MAKFRMTLIDPPSWANQPDLSVGNVTVAEFAVIQKRRAKLLRAVQREIEAYLNDPRLVFDDDEGFPQRQRLTGTYYIGSESYIGHRSPRWFQISIFCRCLEHSTLGVEGEDDYLGLEVWLKCVPGRWSFTIFRNTDSSSI
jgi:hypothetical protein